MNSVMETIVGHRSVRKFKDIDLSKEQVEQIVQAAQSASTSSFMQAYSIIGVTDKEKKKKLAVLAGNQSYVENNGHLFIFCADLFRHSIAAEMEGKDISASLETTEKFMVSVIDASLAAQNASIAAESIGLGICYIGGLRNNLPEVCSLLNIPERVIPLFALVVGYPDQHTEKKPRIPFHHIYHENEYEQDMDTYKQGLKEYNKIISAYYKERTGNARSDNWTAQMTGMLEGKSRLYMNEFIKKQKMDLR
ncbi:oxygen-insensitive NADPH nitroreductase [Niallia nealsonii]|uniref:Oxygen-insensitive NADPH nitroreductase n=1 Tax=Niallia nealsonii TaxID=115979 RepID=A0A2N0Z775_9BACI|nr:oxygen-insensitive NADPH nitroreductase [Niallia nealsonii]PKG25375.1 oxygen-insensitive NADPH nitroreductase [Niallia nealsonii]